MVALAEVTLDDKFLRTEGRIYLSAPQALVRIPIVQRRLDVKAGLNTAGFISGYRGSPLGTYDLALGKAAKVLEQHHIRFQPGVNEELAATSIYGTQQLDMYGPASYDGVFGVWYGKGPGVDRAGDALKHGNLAGTHERGGVLVLAGDDHTAKSSTTAHQSEQALVAAMIPVLYPSDIQDYLDFGAFAVAFSRYSGLWTGFKCVNDTADATASVIARASYDFVRPQDIELPPEGINIRLGEVQSDHERKLVNYRLPAAQAFVRANRLDRVVADSERRTLGIVTAGKAYHDVMQALASLGLSAQRMRELGIRVYKLGMTWPIESHGALGFCAGHRCVLVIEEKRGFIEPQLKDILYNLRADLRPAIVGKQDLAGRPLISSIGELNPQACANALVHMLEELGLADPTLRACIEEWRASRPALPGGGALTDIVRTAYFCSGCPHNTSTQVPEGSTAVAGIGCHAMAGLMPHRLHKWPMQMGGEGANWIGLAPFSKTRHVFQNLGDGTYFHSGFLAIRAAVAAGACMTYKLLVNDAVAMTGGQAVEGQLSVPRIARELIEEGVRKVVVVADDLGRYEGGSALPATVTLHHRDELDAVQRELREIPGVTVLIYDQICAAEKRRRRKRGRLSDPPKRVLINDLVCEGCSDCSVKSNCVAVLPLETEFGRKRAIDQSSCNKDFSCVKGFCPSFVSVVGGELRSKSAGRRIQPAQIPSLPAPAVAALDGAYSILITGIGGTGVVTIGAILGMAAHLEGKACTVVDMIGMSQKNGAVQSHVKIGDAAEEIHAARISSNAADVLLACDLIVAGAGDVATALKRGRTAGVLNTHLVPTALFQYAPDTDFHAGRTVERLLQVCDPTRSVTVDGTSLATGILGDSIASNLLMLGVALQRGLLPVSLQAIERAIELNGVSVQFNQMALQLGRWAAHDPAAVLGLARRAEAAGAHVDFVPSSHRLSESVDEMIARRASFLDAYQNAAWAKRYMDLVSRARSHEAKLMPKGDQRLTQAVARYAFKLMAYKDEYEVARLYTNGEFVSSLERQFAGNYKLQFHLAPPLLAKRDKVTGEPRKLTFGSYVLPLFKVLAKLRFLRGTPIDPFGRTAERRAERRLIETYHALVDELLTSLSSTNYELAIEIASYPEKIRGYGHVKERSMQSAEAHKNDLLRRYRDNSGVQQAA